MRRYTNHKEGWGEFVDVKINALEILTKQLRSENSKGAKRSIYISSVTDPYQPLERKYQLTRKILEILAEHDFKISIQTKSSLVLRDIDLIKKFSDIEIGFTIVTLDDEIRKRFEPFSSTINERFDALRILRENGIRTYIFFGPMLPLLSDKGIEETIRKFSSLADFIYFDKLNIKYGNWFSIKKTLERFYPSLIKRYEEILFTKNDYYRILKDRIKKECEKNKIDHIFCY